MQVAQHWCIGLFCKGSKGELAKCGGGETSLSCYAMTLCAVFSTVQSPYSRSAVRFNA